MDDLLLTGWQHHIDAITKALLAKYVMKKSSALPYSEQGVSVSEASDGIDFLGARITRDADGTVWCDQSKYIQHCPRENGFYNQEGHAVLGKAHAPPSVDEKLGEEEGSVKEKNECHGSVSKVHWSNDVADNSHQTRFCSMSGHFHGQTTSGSQMEILVDNHGLCHVHLALPQSSSEDSEERATSR